MENSRNNQWNASEALNINEDLVAEEKQTRCESMQANVTCDTFMMKLRIMSGLKNASSYMIS